MNLNNNQTREKREIVSALAWRMQLPLIEHYLPQAGSLLDA